MKVVLVEDSALLRERLVQTIASIDGISLVGYAETAPDAIELIKERQPDAIVLDIRLRQGTGLQVLQAVKTTGQLPWVIVLTNFAFPQYRKKYLDSGADYFLDKSNEFDQISVVLKELMDKEDRHDA